MTATSALLATSIPFSPNTTQLLTPISLAAWRAEMMLGDVPLTENSRIPSPDWASNLSGTDIELSNEMSFETAVVREFISEMEMHLTW